MYLETNYLASSNSSVNVVGGLFDIGAILASIMAYFAFVFILGILIIIAYCKIFKKFNKPMWAAIVPIYNVWVIFEIVKMPGWLALIPGVNTIIMVYSLYQIPKLLGKSTGFAIGTVLLPYIFLIILAFDKSSIENDANNNQPNNYEMNQNYNNQVNMGTTNQINNSALSQNNNQINNYEMNQNYNNQVNMGTTNQVNNSSLSQSTDQPNNYGMNQNYNNQVNMGTSNQVNNSSLIQSTDQQPNNSQQTVFCSNCGAQKLATDTFCNKCGFKN